MKRSQAAMAEAGSAWLVVGVGDFELRLLGVAAIGIARFQLLEILDRLVVAAVAHGFLGLGIQPVGGPAGGLVASASGSSPQPPIDSAATVNTSRAEYAT
jgi:hypothetical protein